VLLVGDSGPYLDPLSEVLGTCPGLSVIGTARDIEGALASVRDLRPDVVVMDVSPFAAHWSHATSRLREASPNAGIVALSLWDVEPYRPYALAAGADDLVSKVRAATELPPAILRAARRRDGGHS